MSNGLIFKQLYSQAAAVKIADARMKSLETTMLDMKRLLELVQLQTDGSY